MCRIYFTSKTAMANQRTSLPSQLSKVIIMEKTSISQVDYLVPVLCICLIHFDQTEIILHWDSLKNTHIMHHIWLSASSSCCFLFTHLHFFFIFHSLYHIFCQSFLFRPSFLFLLTNLSSFSFFPSYAYLFKPHHILTILSSFSFSPSYMHISLPASSYFPLSVDHFPPFPTLQSF